MNVEQKLHTIAEFEDFLATAPSGLFELVHGEMVEKLPTQEHGIIAARLAARLTVFVEDNRLGRVAVEARHRPPQDDYNDRLPDISFTAGYAPVVKEGAVLGMPDLAVEIKSPTDSYRHMREAADFYIANGCRLVWLIYPDSRSIEVYRLHQPTQHLTEADTLSGEDVLPNFTLLVNYLFIDLD